MNDAKKATVEDTRYLKKILIGLFLQDSISIGRKKQKMLAENEKLKPGELIRITYNGTKAIEYHYYDDTPVFEPANIIAIKKNELAVFFGLESNSSNIKICKVLYHGRFYLINAFSFIRATCDLEQK